MTYEGWENYDTWNVALWINNDFGIYTKAVTFMAVNPDPANPYKAFIVTADLSDKVTPDDIEWMSDKLDYDSLNDMMLELVA